MASTPSPGLCLWPGLPGISYKAPKSDRLPLHSRTNTNHVPSWGAGEPMPASRGAPREATWRLLNTGCRHFSGNIDFCPASRTQNLGMGKGDVTSQAKSLTVRGGTQPGALVLRSDSQIQILSLPTELCDLLKLLSLSEAPRCLLSKVGLRTRPAEPVRGV